MRNANSPLTFAAVVGGLTTLTAIYAYKRYRDEELDFHGGLVDVSDHEVNESLSPFGHMVTKYRNWARANLGLLEDTKVNRIILSEALRKQMRLDNVRDADISKYLGTCIELALTPTRMDLRARKLGASRRVQARKMVYARPVATFTEWLFGLGAASEVV